MGTLRAQHWICELRVAQFHKCSLISVSHHPQLPKLKKLELSDSSIFGGLDVLGENLSNLTHRNVSAFYCKISAPWNLWKSENVWKPRTCLTVGLLVWMTRKDHLALARTERIKKPLVQMPRWMVSMKKSPAKENTRRMRTVRRRRSLITMKMERKKKV